MDKRKQGEIHYITSAEIFGMMCVELEIQTMALLRNPELCSQKKSMLRMMRIIRNCVWTRLEISLEQLQLAVEPKATCQTVTCLVLTHHLRAALSTATVENRLGDIVAKISGL